MSAAYLDFLEQKSHTGALYGFDPVWLPSEMMDFQCSLTEWAIRKGRSAVFADCGLGKTLIQLAFAENVARHTGGNVLILTPLAVAAQTVHEGERFGIGATLSRDGRVHRITVTNYHMFHRFNPSDFDALVCDESSILKNFDGAIRNGVNEFARKVPYRLLCTATAAPNDFTELGTSSEALGELGHIDMLNRFFKNDKNNSSLRRHYGEAPEWRFKGHAETPFWRWVCSWARSIRRPSDLGFDDGAFVLPPLDVVEHQIDSDYCPPDQLFHVPSNDLFTQRQTKRGTLHERCEAAAALVNGTSKPFVMWCQHNDEGNVLEKLCPDAVQVSGKDSDDAKEFKFTEFQEGRVRGIITKASIGGWGLNWQHCAHTVYFPSHSYEAYYQAIRRFWRFGQRHPVRVDLVMTEGEKVILANLKRKAVQADQMFDNLVREMQSAQSLEVIDRYTKSQEVPAWLQSN